MSCPLGEGIVTIPGILIAIALITLVGRLTITSVSLIAQLVIIAFVFLLGADLQLGLLRGSGYRVAVLGVGMVAIPLICGMLLAGVIGQNLFVMFVIMTLVTTTVAGPLLKWFKLDIETSTAEPASLASTALLRVVSVREKSGGARTGRQQ